MLRSVLGPKKIDSHVEYVYLVCVCVCVPSACLYVLLSSLASFEDIWIHYVILSKNNHTSSEIQVLNGFDASVHVMVP